MEDLRLGEHSCQYANYRDKQEVFMGELDNEDSGCQKATDFLGGRQSHCLQCPFLRCVHDKKLYLELEDYYSDYRRDNKSLVQREKLRG